MSQSPYRASEKRPGIDVVPITGPKIHHKPLTTIVPTTPDNGERILVRRPQLEQMQAAGSKAMPPKRPLNAFMIDPKYLRQNPQPVPKASVAAASRPRPLVASERVREPVVFRNAVASPIMAERIRRPRTSNAALSMSAASISVGGLYDDYSSRSRNLLAAAAAFIAGQWHTVVNYSSRKLHELRVRHTRLTYSMREGVIVHDTEAWVKHLLPAALVLFVGFSLLGTMLATDGGPAPTKPQGAGGSTNNGISAIMGGSTGDGSNASIKTPGASVSTNNVHSRGAVTSTNPVKEISTAGVSMALPTRSESATGTTTGGVTAPIIGVGGLGGGTVTNPATGGSGSSGGTGSTGGTTSPLPALPSTPLDPVIEPIVNPVVDPVTPPITPPIVAPILDPIINPTPAPTQAPTQNAPIQVEAPLSLPLSVDVSTPQLDVGLTEDPIISVPPIKLGL